MRKTLFAAVLGSLICVPGSFAGLDTSGEIQVATDLELLVMEAPGCTYCALFRRDVLPSYQTSERAKEMPVRFIDINDANEDALGLDGRVDIVPTFVILKNSKEIGRIPGYLGPEYFFHSINHVISSSP